MDLGSGIIVWALLGCRQIGDDLSCMIYPKAYEFLDGSLLLFRFVTIIQTSCLFLPFAERGICIAFAFFLCITDIVVDKRTIVAV